MKKEKSGDTGKKIRLMLLLPDLSGGGAERTAVNLVRTIDRTRFIPVIALLNRSGPYLGLIDNPDDIMVPGKRDRGVLPVNSLQKPRLREKIDRILRIPLSVFQINRMINRFRPDLIVSFMPGMGFFTNLTRRLFRKKQIPWASREGNNLDLVINSLTRSKLFNKLVRRIMSWNYRSTTRMIAISRGVGAMLNEKFGIPQEQIKTVYNPVDIAGIRKLARRKTDKDYGRYIISIGRLETQKGYRYLLDAYAASRFRDSVNLVIIGKGSQEAELRDRIRALGLEGKVFLHGFEDNPWAYIARAEAFVFASLWEGFGHVVVEAMACGTPVISTECDYGPAEIIGRGGRNGLLVPVRDSAALTKAMDSLLGSAPRRKRMAEAAQRRAEDFHIKRITAEYEALFTEMYREKEGTKS